MAGKIYITAMEPHSGKSVVSLGFMEMLCARLERVGFFRPLSSGSEDPEIELIRSRYPLGLSRDQMHAMSSEAATALIAEGAHAEIDKRVVASYRELERRCDFVVCEGTDVGGPPVLDFELNVHLANQLGCPVLVVVNGASGRDVVESVRLARESIERRGGVLFGVIVNRVAPDEADPVQARLAPHTGEEWVYVMPESEELACPNVGEVLEALDARMLFDMPDTLEREVREVRIAAMSVEHFIEDLVDGTLVLVPADRPEILVACLASALSAVFPAIAGIVLTGGYALSDTVRRLLESAPFPVLEVEQRTHLTATRVHAVRPQLRVGDERRIATALGLFERSVDRVELGLRFNVRRPERMTPVMFEYELIERARSARRHIVLPEGEDDRILRAADMLLRRGVVELTLLGPEEALRGRAAALGLDLDGVAVVDPLSSPLRERFAEHYAELRRHKGVTSEAAFDTVGDPSYFGTMMVHTDAVDGMVSGAAHTTGDTIRPAFELIRARPGTSVVSSVFFMCLADRVLVYGDCAVNPSPDSSSLADIAISSAETAATFGIVPRIAMLSYSTGDSARGQDVDAVREATELVRRRRADLMVEGPIQYDAAVDMGVARLKLPGSEVAGSATVFIFPDLDTGNVAYKAVQRSAGAVAVGPVLQGLRKPVNDLSRGCTVTDIVNTVAITAIQAQEAR